MLDEFDIDEILSDVAKFRNHVAEVHRRLTHPKEKELLGTVISRIDETRSEVKEKYTAAIGAMEKGLQQAKEKTEANQAEAARIRVKLAELQKVKEAAAAAAPAAPEPPEFDFQLGNRLSQELSARFMPPTESAAADKITDREIWQDWSWTDRERN